ncbi:hypothetical protein HRQ91_10905 [Treponema parvum]|uniref:Lipoprotein n=1 Tax=Treponema parvum TaxID=138851 RepID=A0A975IFF2_9SPIR|nr:hypothetical protein [Treponema parvum]QTQ14926.1 hypothetical protein HRQ91_10905 [Treponema parvum]
MKKAALILVSFLFVLCASFAQEQNDVPETKAADTTIEVITPKNIHSDVRSASVKIEYIRIADEVRIYYSCLDVQFDQGSAMVSLLACLKDFQVENQYYSYTYLAKDRTRYYTDPRTKMKMAQYSSYVKFNR